VRAALARRAPAARLLAIADPAMGEGVDVLPVFEPDSLAPPRSQRGTGAAMSVIREVNSGPPLPRHSFSSPSQFSAFLKERQRLSSNDQPRLPSCAPVVEILGLSTNIDQPVDRARTAEARAPRGIEDGPSGGAGIGFGMKAPGQGRMIEELHKARRDMDVGAPIAPAPPSISRTFAVGSLAQTVGENAARRAGRR